MGAWTGGYRRAKKLGEEGVNIGGGAFQKRRSEQGRGPGRDVTGSSSRLQGSGGQVWAEEAQTRSEEF